MSRRPKAHAPNCSSRRLLVGEIRAAGAARVRVDVRARSDPAAEAAAAVARCTTAHNAWSSTPRANTTSCYGAAQLFVRTLRSQLGAAFPIGLASQAEVAQHPRFPYSVFLGPGGFNVVLP